MRFSILTLLGLVAFAAAGTAALLNANDFWAKASYSIVSVTLLVAVIAGLTLRGRARAFWIGFAVFGIAFFSNLLFDKANLLSSTVSDYIFQRINGLPTEPTTTVFPSCFGGTSPMLVLPEKASPEFATVFNSIFSLLFAFIGGLIARYFYSLRQKQNAQAAERRTS